MFKNKLTFREKVICFKIKFIFELKLIFLIDKEFKLYIKSFKIFIWLSLIFLFMYIIYQIIGYSL